MQISIGTFIKKQNSTMRPGGLDQTLNVELKRDTTIINPVFRLKGSSFSPSYNYVHVPAWNRYYFITNANYVIGDIIEVECVEDYGATWRDEIAASNLYVLRSAAEYDGYVVDNAYPAKVDYTIQETEVSAPWDSIDFSGGTYVCGIVGGALTGVGSVTYWAFDRSELRQLLVNLMGGISWYQVSVEEVSENLQKMLFNPLQYFVSCIWFPFNKTAFTGSDGVAIKYGWWTLEQTGKMLTSTAPIHKTSYLQALPHPQTERGSYLNSPPFTRKFVRYLPFGTFEIDPQFFPSNTTVVLYTSVDVITGVGVLRVAKEAGDDWRSYQTIQAQVGVPVQLSQIGYNYSSISNGVTSLASGAAAGAFMAGGVGAVIGAAAMIGNAASSFVPQLQSSGINGGLSGLDTDITLTHYFSMLVDEDRENHGRPLCKLRTLGTLPGYQLIQEGDVVMGGTDSERAAVKALLEGGYYFE